MQTTSTKSEQRRRAWIGGAVAAAAGALFLVTPLGQAFADWSYDLLFALRPDVPVDEVVLVYMDDVSHEQLGQPLNDRWDRTIHARLLNRLTAARARAVVFDVWFAGPTPQDAQLRTAIAEAIKAGTQVVLAGDVLSEDVAGQPAVQRVMPPFSERSSAQVGGPATGDELPVPWGIVHAGSGQRDARKHFRPLVPDPTLAWRVAEVTGKTPPSDSDQARWFNFYGPPGHLRSFSYHRALDPEAIPDQAFAGKVVFVGANTGLGFTGGTGTDHFVGPYGLWTTDKYPGVDLNATAYLNLARGDWMRRLPPGLEFLGTILAGLGLGAAVCRCRPAVAVAAGVLCALAVATGACALAWTSHWWFAWLNLAAVQMPIAVGWGVLSNARRLSQENEILESRLKTVLTPPLPPNPGEPVVAQRDPVATALGPGAEPPAIPDHALLKCVGSGAYGEIWLARNAIGTYHAVKIIRRSAFNNDEPYEREFRGLQKFMPISRSHPGLVQILHVGRNDAAGVIYYVMEVADDETGGQSIDPDTYSTHNLSRLIWRRGCLEASEALDLALPLSAALGHLHSHRLVHRDIKPANIIFVNGAPKLADIGLVTEINSLRESSFVGTEGYIPPEGPGRPAADVFALGLVFYEAAMGLSRDAFPALPDGTLERPDAELLLALNDIILRCGAPELSHRYQNGTELHADLARLRQSKTRRSS